MMPAPTATRWARKGDRTAEAVRTQLAGMGAERYDVGVYDRQNDAMLLRREWMPARIEASIGWFKKMNAQGRDIYTVIASSCSCMSRPAGRPRL